MSTVTNLGNQFLWWEDEAEEAYQNRTRCMVDQYDNFPWYHNGQPHRTNGTRTLGENIADNGGIKLAYR